MSLVSFLRGRRGKSGFGYASSAEEVTAGLDLTGRHILVTGVASGLGFESARVLAQRGATILGAARTLERASAACSAFGPRAIALECELSEPVSVRAAANEVKKLGIQLDVILCNAGIMALPNRQVKHGQELQFLTNHIGHFILVQGLRDVLAPEARVVVLSSEAHRMAPPSGIRFDDLGFEQGYRPWLAYGHSKLANLLFARALARRLPAGQTANAVHPGVIGTDLWRHLGLVAKVVSPVISAVALKSIPEGASTQCFVATRPELAGVTGEYFSNCNLAQSSAHGADQALADRLWEVTERIVQAL